MSDRIFIVSKLAGAFYGNGGGPRAEANGSPVDYISNACDSDSFGTTITDTSGQGFSSSQVGDYICFDPDGVLEYTRITGIGGTLDEILTVSPAVTPNLIDKTVNVGGHWDTIDIAIDSLTLTLSGGSSIKLYIRQGTYNEVLTCTVSGAPESRISYEGYEDTIGDECPDGNYPIIDGTGLGGNATVTSSGTYTEFRCIQANGVDTSQNGFTLTGNYTRMAYCRMSSASGDGMYADQCHYSTFYKVDVTEASQGHGIIATVADGLFDFCTVENVGGNALHSGYPTSIYLNCVAANYVGYGIRIYDRGSVINCTFYNGATGVTGASEVDNAAIYNNIFVDITGTAIDLPNQNPWISHNAYYNCGTEIHADIKQGQEHSITLSVDPLTDAVNGDYSLNNTVGGGADCRGAAIHPNMDLGALQTAIGKRIANKRGNKQ